MAMTQTTTKTTRKMMNKTIEQRIDEIERETMRGWMALLYKMAEAAKKHYREDPETFDLEAWKEKMFAETPYSHSLVIFGLERWHCREEHGYDPYQDRQSADLTDVDYGDVSGIGTKTASSIVDFIEDNNIRTKRQLLTDLREKMDSVDGLGEGNMTNLEDYFDLPEPDDGGGGDDSGEDEDAGVTKDEQAPELDVLEYDYKSIKRLGSSTQENIRDFIRERGIETMPNLLDELEENIDEVTGLGPTTLERLRKKVENE